MRIDAELEYVEVPEIVAEQVGYLRLLSTVFSGSIPFVRRAKVRF